MAYQKYTPHMAQIDVFSCEQLSIEWLYFGTDLLGGVYLWVISCLLFFYYLAVLSVLVVRPFVRGGDEKDNA